MPVTPTYPGVYIEEVPSGVRTITGVATSIAAFVGWAPKGPTDRAQRILSWMDFERQYAGLDPRSYLGYAVYHFFANGGQQAYVVRLVADDAQEASATIGGLTLTAKNKGDWAESYSISTKRLPVDPPGTPTRFQLAIVQGTDANAKVETFPNLSMDATDRRSVGTVITEESQIVNASVSGTSTTPPTDTTVPLANGQDGTVLMPNTPAFTAELNPTAKDGGIYLLDRIDLFNLLCVPGETDAAVLSELEGFCRERRAFLIVDCEENPTYASLQGGPPSALTGADAINAAFYFPWIKAPNSLDENRPKAFPPCGFVAGLYAKTDANQGVWKAPAGTEASLTGVLGVERTLTDDENGVLNVQAINCIRTFPIYGTVIWGARTLHGHNERGSEWKYIPVRRMALYIEETLYRSLKWVVFEPNDEPLWADIRLNVGQFMHDLFRRGAFQGQTPREAYFVKCDGETTTQSDINQGIVNIEVGFAPLKPAEFVIVKLQQMAGQLAI
jgi:phage tail sheath protein FI